jgi:glutathione S-transferase
VVPTLIVDGAPVLESTAILMLLAERHADKDLAPAAGTPERAAYFQWMVYLANALLPSFRAWYYPHEAAGQANADAAQAAARARIEAVWDRVDAQLAAKGPYMLGERLSAVDFLATMLMRWSRNLPRQATAWPNIARYLAEDAGHAVAARGPCARGADGLDRRVGSVRRQGAREVDHAHVAIGPVRTAGHAGQLVARAEDVAAVAASRNAAVDDQLADDVAGILETIGDVLGREPGPDALAAQPLAQRAGGAMAEVAARALGLGVLAGRGGDPPIRSQGRQRGLALQEVDRLFDGGGIVAAVQLAAQLVGVVGRTGAGEVELVQDRVIKAGGVGGGRQGENQQAGERRSQGHAAGHAHARSRESDAPSLT